MCTICLKQIEFETTITHFVYDHHANFCEFRRPAPLQYIEMYMKTSVNQALDVLHACLATSREPLSFYSEQALQRKRIQANAYSQGQKETAIVFVQIGKSMQNLQNWSWIHPVKVILKVIHDEVV
jgi:hypothetical protein